ncbi:19827_t:CDS:2, partial [Gigaspora rosea]
HVGAAAEKMPQDLIDQLKSPGRQYIYQIDKDSDGNVTKKSLMGVMYVPLTDAQKQLRGE